MTESTESTPRRASRRARRTTGSGVSSRAGRLFRIGLALLAAMLVVESLFGSRGLSAMFQARRDYATSTTDLERLRAENARLRAEATRLREDPTAIEEAARRDLGFIAPGEKLFIIHDARPAPTTPPVPTPK